MLRLIAIAALALLPLTVSAKERVTIVTPGSPNGAAGTSAREFGKQLEDRYDVRFVSTDGNCALAKNIFETSPGIRFYVSATTIPGSFEKENRACVVTPTRDNWIGVTQIGPLQFCSVGPRTLDDFLRRGTEHRLSLTMRDSNLLFDEIDAYYGIRTRRIVDANASINTFRQQARAGEVDFGWRIGIDNIPEKTNCYFNTDTLKATFPFLRNDYSHLKEWGGVFVGAGFNMANKPHYVNALRRAYEGDTLVKMRYARAVRSEYTNWSTETEWTAIRDNFFREFWDR